MGDQCKESTHDSENPSLPVTSSAHAGAIMVAPADEQDNRQDKSTQVSVSQTTKRHPDRWPVTGKLGAIKNEGEIQ